MGLLDLFKQPYRQEMPKAESQYPSVVDELLAELNRLEAQYDYSFGRGIRVRETNVIIEHRMTEIKRKLLHEYNATPMYKGQRWELYLWWGEKWRT